MTMRPKYLFPALAVLVTATALAQSSSQSQPAASQSNAKPAAAAPAAAKPVSDGERVFQQQCARCHNSPDGFSSRISGTVVHHMRVRASLSKHDQEELLRFLNP
jgi:cytochrome c5